MASTGTGNKPEGLNVTFEAASDLSSYQYRAVILDTNGRVTYGTGGTLTNTSPAIGILQNKPANQGSAAHVMVDGVSKIYAEGALTTLGAFCTFGTAGGGSALAAAGTSQVIGQVVKTADTAGDYAEVLIRPFRYVFGS